MEMKDLYPFYQQLVRIADALESISDALDRIESGQNIQLSALEDKWS